MKDPITTRQQLKELRQQPSEGYTVDMGHKCYCPTCGQVHFVKRVEQKEEKEK